MKSPTTSASTTTGCTNWAGRDDSNPAVVPGRGFPGFGDDRCYERLMSAECRDCRAGLDHCHGTIIRHALHRSECTEVDCVSPELVSHTFVVDCDAVGCECAESVASVIDRSL